MTTPTKPRSVQYPVVAEVSFLFSLTEATSVAAIPVPAGAKIIDIQIYADTAWDSATSATMLVGDGDDPNRFVTAHNLKATTVASMLLKGYQYTIADDIEITVTNVGTPTAGAGRLIVTYIVENRAHENQI